MNTSLASISKSKGSVLVLTALSLVVLIGMAGLAIDLSHAEVNKTRLQNLADALALSAAISLNKKESSLTAQNYATNNTYPTFSNSLGNQEIKDQLGNLTVTYSFAVDHPGPYDAASNTDFTRRFARVVITNMNIATWFASVLGFNNVAVSVSAVAGTTPIIPCNDILPILVCAKNGNTDTQCLSGASTCFGYSTNTDFCLKSDAKTDASCPDIPAEYTGLISGNFGWLDVGAGGHAVNDCAAGDPACAANFCANYSKSQPLTSKPGNDVAIAHGFNTRFDEYKGGYNDPVLYPPDRIVGGNPSSTAADNATRSDGASLSPNPAVFNPPLPSPQQAISDTATPTNLYKNYYRNDPRLTSTPQTTDATHTPKNSRRILAAPFIDCSSVTKNGGTFTVPADKVKGWGCFFITQPMGGTGNNSHIHAELLDASSCLASGIVTNNKNTGIYKVQLYKDPFGVAS